MLKINNPTTMKGINMKRELTIEEMNGIVKTTLNKLPKNKRNMFYRKPEQIFLTDRYFLLKYFINTKNIIFYIYL